MNETQNRSLRKRVVAGSAALTVAGGGILLMGLSVANPANAAPADKWFVCKFVGTPGDLEFDQTGNNPISIAVSSILAALPPGSTEADIHQGTLWVDAQNSSIVFGPDTTGNGGGQTGEPSVADCESLIQPPPTTEPPATSEPPETSAPPASTAVAAPSSEAVVEPGPVPGAVEAGKHTVSSTSIALGGALMVAGAGGLVFAARRPRKQHTG